MCTISYSENNQVSEIDKLLQQNVGKDLLIKLKNNVTVQGKLKNFDQHMNLTLKNGNVEFSNETKPFQDMLVRGSEILMVSLLSNASSNPK